ncbi:glycosyltransferase [Nostocoides sp. F2B08]|nr:glycosyltransferase [Tetrasphaera sp. F2B08]
MRIAVVGPTYPFKGGVAAHTTALAHELEETGHEVALVSWRHLYPSRLYPGEQVVPAGAPDVAPYPRTSHPLSWARPDSWWRTGRRLQEADVVILVHVLPAVVPAHLALIRAARGGAARPTIVALVHNVLPHEPRPGDQALMRRFFGAVDAVLVHSAEEARAAHDLGAPDVTVAALPPHLPGGDPAPRPRRTGRVALLALGIVRHYKGLDLVLEALREVPDLTLTVAGELWGAAGERVRELASDPVLADRVRLRPGYVPADEVAGLLAEHDALVLAYRSATGSQNVLLAHHHGLPVLATDVGTLGAQVRDGVDGLVVPAIDRAALVAALRSLADRGTVERLRDGITAPDLSGPWARYVAAIETIAAGRTVEAVRLLDPAPGEGAVPRPGLSERAAEATTALAAGALSAARTVRALARRETDLGPRDLPDWVRPTDVLLTDDEAEDVVVLARSLGLPWLPALPGSAGTDRRAAAWAALGALSAVLRVRDGERRSSLVVDAAGTSTVFARWARAIGYAPVALRLSDPAIDPGSLDVVVRLHPNGCTADDVDRALAQAARLLRRGGLVSLTLPVHKPAGATAPPGGAGAGAGAAVSPADLRAVAARADAMGLALVGDLDRDIAPLLGDLEPGADALARLTYRRR